MPFEFRMNFCERGGTYRGPRCFDFFLVDRHTRHCVCERERRQKLSTLRAPSFRGFRLSGIIRKEIDWKLVPNGATSDTSHRENEKPSPRLFVLSLTFARFFYFHKFSFHLNLIIPSIRGKLKDIINKAYGWSRLFDSRLSFVPSETVSTNRRNLKQLLFDDFFSLWLRAAERHVELQVCVGKITSCWFEGILEEIPRNLSNFSNHLFISANR